MIYRPAPGLAAGSEEEGSFPGPPAQLPSKPQWVCLATAAPRGPMPVLPRGGSHAHCSTQFCYRSSCFCT